MADDSRLKIKVSEKIENMKVRFRTLGCYPLTAAIKSEAVTIEEIISELMSSKSSERQGRLIDHDQIGAMEKKKQEGYF
jgi:sulfate adenylyltransferase subunit 2